MSRQIREHSVYVRPAPNEYITLGSQRQERTLRKLGARIPVFPRQGTVTYRGKSIGFADNFNGVRIMDRKFLKKLANKRMPVWYSNYPSGWMEGYHTGKRVMKQ